MIIKLNNTAETLAKIMDDLFGGVVYVGIDFDKYKYPTGSGRVTFANLESYMRAVAAKFLQIKSGKIQKKIQINPFLEETLCALCAVQRGLYFCPELLCFQ